MIPATNRLNNEAHGISLRGLRKREKPTTIRGIAVQ